MLRFLALFLFLLFGLLGLELTRPAQAVLVMPWTGLLAGFCATLVKAFDPQVLAYGNILQSTANGFAVAIQPGCNGVEACIILVAGMLAFPASWRLRLIGLAIGIVAVQAVNVLRVISLFYLGQWNFAWFEFAHLYLWQALIILDALVVWLLWLRWLSRRAPPPTAGASVAAA